MSKKEEFTEIFETLRELVKFRGQSGMITDGELRDITKRVFEYRNGPELHQIIMAISTDKYFPSGFEIEQRVRAAKGLKPLKGLTEDLIEKNETELIVSGQSVKNAKAGAELLRKTLRKDVAGSVQLTASDIEKQKESMGTLKPLDGLKEEMVEVFNEKLLEEFDKQEKELIDAIDSF